MGRIVAPFGVKGWIKVEPWTAAAKNLLAYPAWWIGDGEHWQERQVGESRTQGRMVVARLDGCSDRDAAAELRGKQVAVPRERLPQPQSNEYYWADLIGLRVVNEAGRDFGQVVRILETGANDVLVVQGERERLIPFIADAIAAVDLQGGVMRVNWDPDF
jgi:16S rRNA processing protein RimM